MKASRGDFIRLGLQNVFIIRMGNSLQSFTLGKFSLPSKNEIALRFAIASDGHYDEPLTAYEAYHDEMGNWLNAEQGRGVDFAFINGDLFHNDAVFLEPVKKKWDGLQMPYYVSHGNHDNTNPENWEKIWNLKQGFAFEKIGRTDNFWLILIVYFHSHVWPKYWLNSTLSPEKHGEVV